MKILRWVVALIIGFFAALFGASIAVTILELVGVWLPLALFNGGVVSAFCFVYFSIMVSRSNSFKTVKALSVAIIITALISATGAFIGQSSYMPPLGLLIAAWVFLWDPNMFVKSDNKF